MNWFAIIQSVLNFVLIYHLWWLGRSTNKRFDEIGKAPNERVARRTDKAAQAAGTDR